MLFHTGRNIRILLIVVNLCLLIYIRNADKLEKLSLKTSNFRKISETLDSSRTHIEKKEVLLFIAILSSNKYRHRRDALRITWCKFCAGDKNCFYKFFLDGLDLTLKPLNEQVLESINKESIANNHDIEVLETPIGRSFAIRFYKALIYADTYFKYDYFLRIDDDQYLCVDRLIYELKVRTTKNIFWGYAHCDPIPRIDEGFLLTSSDLSLQLTGKRLNCSTFGTEAISSWVYDLMDAGVSVTWFTDPRILHTPPVENVKELFTRNEICQSYLSLHGVWKLESMKRLHEIASSEKVAAYAIPIISFKCQSLSKRIPLTTLDSHGPVELCTAYSGDKFNEGRPYIGRDPYRPEWYRQ